MLNELIDSIVNAIDESTVSVCESVVSHLDKYEMILEYSENMDLLSQYVDTFDIYMESKNRERDKTPRNEISKWMEKNGYWYTGDNPKKKKECMRMYHFLQQYEFDPNDETILVVAKEGEKPRRVKFDVDAKKYILERVKCESDQESAMSQAHGVQNGKLALMNYFENRFDSRTNDPDPMIVMGSKELKSKQAYNQMSHGHESGHEDRLRQNQEFETIYPSRGQSFKPYKKSIKNTTIVTSDDPRAQEGIDFYNDIGRPKLNKHDDKCKEADADRFAAENAMKRTKNWGKNKETKHMSQHDVEKYFRKTSAELRKNPNYAREYPYDDKAKMDSSTKFRSDYAKKYVKEYFTEYFIY